MKHVVRYRDLVTTHLRDLLRAPTRARDETRLRLLQTIMVKTGNQVSLSRRTGLSAASVSDALKDLADAGIVRLRRDRREVLAEMAPTDGVAVGIELGYQHTAIVARRVDQPFDQALAKVYQVGATRGPRMWLDEVIQGIREIVSEAGQHADDIATIGLAIPRMVDPRSGVLTPPLLSPWDVGESPAKLIQDELSASSIKLRIFVDNDASLTALAESIYAFPDVETLVGLKVSTGVGAGLIVGGRIFRGHRGVAGELGHTVVDPGGRFCSCGGRGCLETVIGSDALLEQARTVLGHRSRSPASLDDIGARANQGDVVCQKILGEAALCLGFAVGNLCNILNPEVVVIGGAFGRLEAANCVLEPCRNGIRQTAMRAAYEDLKVMASQVPHAGAHGALILGLQATTY